MRRCETCKFLYKQDAGYSNYTVLETVLHCLKKLNPAMPKDEEYRPEGGDPAFAFGETCDGYAEGEGLHIDVDHDEVPFPISEGRSIVSYYTEDPEIVAAFGAYEGEPRP